MSCIHQVGIECWGSPWDSAYSPKPCSKLLAGGDLFGIESFPCPMQEMFHAGVSSAASEDWQITNKMTQSSPESTLHSLLHSQK